MSICSSKSITSKVIRRLCRCLTFLFYKLMIYTRSNNYALKHGNWKLQNSFQSEELKFEMRSEILMLNLQAEYSAFISLVLCLAPRACFYYSALAGACAAEWQNASKSEMEYEKQAAWLPVGPCFIAW
jgi:hypothetical protein